MPFSVEGIGNNWNQPSVDRKFGYPFFHWIHTQSGFGVFQCRDQIIQMKPGLGVFIHPFIPHSYHQSGPEDWITSFIMFNGISAKDIKYFIQCETPLIIDISTDNFFQSTIDGLVSDHDTTNVDYLEHSKACYDFLIHIKKYDDHLNIHGNISYSQYIKPAIEIIEQNYQKDISVKEIAAQVFISPQYLSKLFKQFTGSNTHAYIQKIRIEKSKLLLYYNVEKSISEIAYLTGFKTTSHFIDLFKQATGYTPAVFRKRHSKENYKKIQF